MISASVSDERLISLFVAISSKGEREFCWKLQFVRCLHIGEAGKEFDRKFLILAWKNWIRYIFASFYCSGYSGIRDCNERIDLESAISHAMCLSTRWFSYRRVFYKIMMLKMLYCLYAIQGTPRVHNMYYYISRVHNQADRWFSCIWIRYWNLDEITTNSGFRRAFGKNTFGRTLRRILYCRRTS